MIAAVVLAAGASTRYGRPKQLELLPAVLERLSEATGIDEIVVVEGAHSLAPVRGTGSDSTISFVHCADWDQGPGASLRCGLQALEHDVTHAVIVLADGPTLDPRAVERLIAHRGDGEILAATYDGERSHPVVLARAAWKAVPEQGARALEPILVDCSDLEPPGDIDVPE